jgi:tetratricopeptide (TPR) repeat protein
MKKFLVSWLPDRILKVSVLLFPFLLAACGGTRATQVSPNEIPDLESRLQSEPGNGQVLLRYSAALFSADRCDDAVVAARRGMAVRPGDALGPLVLGQCLEADGDFTGAVDTYDAFANDYPEARGVAAVRSRSMLARRSGATQQARAAIANEQQLSAQDTDPRTVAVLPLTIVGDSIYQPLSRGLAQMITSDLGLLQQFRLLERLQLGAVLDELQFSQGDRVDPSTAARVGRLMRAGRMVSGLTVIPPEGDVRLETTVVLATGEVTSPSSATGRFEDLLRLEKELIVQISSQLGYVLSEAERQAVLENGTQDLTAFLAYSNGLVAEDLGDYQSAARFYQQAVQADPGFQGASDGYEATTSAPEVASASAADVTIAAAQPPPPPPDVPLVTAPEAVMVAVVQDLAPITVVVSDTPTGGDTNTSEPADTPTNEGTPATSTGTVRIVFKLP